MVANAVYVAQKLIASSPNAQIFGAALTAMAENMRAEDLKPILEAYHLDHIDPNTWYPQQVVCDFYKAIIAAQDNASEYMVAIGVQSIESAPVNPSEPTIEAAVIALDAVVRQMERNVPENETSIVVESKPSFVLVVSNTPFPDDLVYGYLWAIARKYKPAGSAFSVKMVPNPNPAQYPGTAYAIKWG